jgi:DNA-binding PadR family transcriptional regulator
MIPKFSTYKGSRISPLQLTILALLRGRSMYGYEILKELRELYRDVWEPQTGSIYPSLRRLEENGLIRSEEREGTNYYALTGEGNVWIKEALKALPVDLTLMGRWFVKMLKRASGEPLQPAHLEEVSREKFREILLTFFDWEHKSDEEKLEQLRIMRQRIETILIEINTFEEELAERHRDDEQ